ncbi:uncharacterized protein A4U43_C01F32280 [Asparagus officinalis]|uniref:Uncharacterized protein n=1 Tax=Asparagus officinalis TaxID=4686 RepID=A0A5P1FU25_ASPOF|nr:uncharacterized protein A4U43_C01F32280 [Asparagus officinalis]
MQRLPANVRIQIAQRPDDRLPVLLGSRILSASGRQGALRSRYIAAFASTYLGVQILGPSPSRPASNRAARTRKQLLVSTALTHSNTRDLALDLLISRRSDSTTFLPQPAAPRRPSLPRSSADLDQDPVASWDSASDPGWKSRRAKGADR